MRDLGTNYVLTLVSSGFLALVAHFGFNTVPLILYWLTSDLPNEVRPPHTSGYHCINGTEGQQVCKPTCVQGYFGLFGMRECHPWLTCDDMKHLTVSDQLVGAGEVKQVYLGTINGTSVAVSRLRDEKYKDDFNHNVNMSRRLAPAQVVNQHVGYCEDTNTLVTEYHRLGTPLNLPSLVSEIPELNTIVSRLKLCADYAGIVNFLHTGPGGTRIMCDSSDLEKTLAQFLITDDLHLLVNDLDALPEVGGDNQTKAVCGRRELSGEFVAPEQLWPHEDKEFDPESQPGYDEKTDIWKFPAVCSALLGDVEGATRAKLALVPIFNSCKQKEAGDRPGAFNVVSFVMHVLREFSTQ